MSLLQVRIFQNGENIRLNKEGTSKFKGKKFKFVIMKIIIIGTGYVGLVTGACLSDVGIEVVCIDIDKKKVDGLNNGIIPIYEPGLETIVKKNIENQRLTFSSSLKKNLTGVDAVFIAVGTPPKDDGTADLQYVENVSKEIGENIDDYLVVVTKSTVPVGTSKFIQKTIQDSLDLRKSEIEFDVASNPEFLKEGAAISDFMSPDRLIIGVESEKAKMVLEQVYKPFQLNGFRIIYMDITSAELTKYAANAMLATRISFINDIANFCELVGADINSVRSGIGSDPRIGNKFLYPGVGYGGSCFPKDVNALIKSAENYGYELALLKSVEEVNERQKHLLAKKVLSHFNQDIKEKTFGVWGLSFKPNTDDMRQAPSIVIIESLLSNGANIKVYDPVAMDEAKKILGDKVIYSASSYETIEDADALLLITEWNEFRSPDWKKVHSLMKSPHIFDGRNIFEKDLLLSFGFQYKGVGIS